MRALHDDPSREAAPRGRRGTARRGTARRKAAGPRRPRGRPLPWTALLFLVPALLPLGFLVVYPIAHTAVRSLFDASGDTFVGLGNYAEVVRDPGNRVAVRNTAIWVVAAPTLVTVTGLLFAVLTERIRWAAAFKLVVFMPMAISFLASGVIFRLVYEQDPDKGVANAAMVAVHDTFTGGGGYPGAAPRPGPGLPVRAPDGAVAAPAPLAAGSGALVPLLRVRPEHLPGDAAPAGPPPGAGPGELTGTVWFDFTRGGGGTPGRPDAGETGLPGLTVEAVRAGPPGGGGDPPGTVAGKATTRADGTFTVRGLQPGAFYTLRLPPENFAAAYGGAEWLGGTLITPAIIGSYLWVWAGFAMVLISAGLAAVPRDVLEAARVDGAGEGRILVSVTVPLLAPVLAVVLVTMVINVLKVFDLVFVIGGGDPGAAVLASRMWTESFGGGGDQGVGSAIAVLLFALVLPAAALNLRRLRRERP
ncbi:carbohydrate ABC transporter permease [Actinomadura rugatobispora]|uniref:Carbohydrate ABC transporter permease n=1 Tax=Actinomadura rugatobispora TaxID=1994 RepID=A0ABW1A0G1_9ACTN|nr:sugar ABC transporter permease [Actinomadura rugatobispora]